MKKFYKFYFHKHRIETYSSNKVWVLLGASIQGQLRYFKEITIYFLKWEFTLGYNWEGWEEDEDGEV